MAKLTVLYGHPTDSASFDEYYADNHLPLIEKIPNLRQFEAGKVIATPEGSEPVPGQPRGVWLGWAAKADDDVTFVFQPSANSPAAGGQGPRAEWDVGPVSELGRGA